MAPRLDGAQFGLSGKTVNTYVLPHTQEIQHGQD